MSSSSRNLSHTTAKSVVCYQHDSPSERPHDVTEAWQQKAAYSPGDIPIETTRISTASVVLSHFPDHSTQRAGSPRPLTDSFEMNLSDYENNSPTAPPQGVLSKSSSSSSSSSFIARPFVRSAHSLSSTSLSSISFSTFQPIEFPSSGNYLFHASDCEDQSDYVPLNIFRPKQGGPTTPSPLISRPSSPLPPTPSPNFSRSPSPNRASRRLQRNFSPGRSNPNSGPGSPLFTRSLNPSRETSPLRLRPSSYTRPLSPNPPTVSPGPSKGHPPLNFHGLNRSSSPRSIVSQPASPDSQLFKTFQSRAMLPSSASQSPLSPSNGHRNFSLRSPPSPTRPASSFPGSRSPNRSPLNARSPVASRPPSPMNAASRHPLLLLLPPNARPARSRSQPSGSHRLHSRSSRSTRTPSPRPPRLPSSPAHPAQQPLPPPPPPTSPRPPDTSRRSSRMRAR